MTVPLVVTTEYISHSIHCMLVDRANELLQLVSKHPLLMKIPQPILCASRQQLSDLEWMQAIEHYLKPQELAVLKLIVGWNGE